MLAAILLIVSDAGAQVQATVSAGSSHFFGDLGGSFTPSSPSFRDLNLRSTRYHATAGIRVHVQPWLALRAGGFFGRLSADDRFTTNYPRQNRNLSFFSPVWGGHAVAEWHFGLGPASEKRFVLFGGGSLFRFNPKAYYMGRAVELQPLGTEGQNFMPGKSPYPLKTTALVAGGAYKFLIFPSGYLALEFSGYKTGTDYLDDASTNYPDKTALLTSSGQLAVEMSDRSLGLIPGFSDAGQKRASPDYKDNFMFISVSCNLTLGANRYPGKLHKGFRPMGGDRHRCFSF